MENTSTVYDDNCHDMIALLENSNNSSLWLPSPSLNDTLLNFDLEPQQDNLLNFDLEPHQGLTTNQKRSRSDAPFARLSEGDDIWEEELDANAFNSQADKKRRLTQEQVKYLEKSFEVENKLEPERKVELAKQLGLQPRQVAVWFQNRRARYKSKQIEKEYDTLKANYDSLKLDYDSLYRKYKNVENERDELKKKLAEKERNEANLNLDILLQLDEEIMNLGAHAKMVNETGGAREVISKTKQAEDLSSAKSDIFDSESPPCSNQQQSSAVQVEASSALMCDLDQQSDFSQEDDEQLMITSNLLMPQTPPTFNNFLNVPEDVNYGANNANNSCNFSLVDEQPGWSWLY